MISNCKFCKKDKDSSLFHKGRRLNGISRLCIECQNEADTRRIEYERVTLHKICNYCKIEKLLSDFNKNVSKKFGYELYCKECSRAYGQSDKIRTAKLARCQINKESISKKNKEYRERNQERIKKERKAWYRENLNIRLFRSAKNRAKQENRPFDITPDDIIIPKYCPVLGIPLFVSEDKCGNNSPSLDKIIPELGYIKTNIVVMSHRANTIKNDSTIEELEKILNFLKNRRKVE